MTAIPTFFARVRLGTARPLWAGFFALFVASMPALADPHFRSRSGGPSESAMISRQGKSPTAELAFVRPVLTGVLYRAGFKG
jgi:hypothetical protein